MLNQCIFGGADLEAVECCGRCEDGECFAPACGDGTTSEGEECDDGNLISGDGCDDDCRPTKIVQIELGDEHSCALFQSGRVRCWGGNAVGQLGLGHTDDCSEIDPYELPTVELGGRATALTAGTDHACALLQDGHVRCWGGNQHGELGLGHQEPVGDDEEPTAQWAEVPLAGPAVKIDAGGDSTCALLDDGKLRCWGDNTFGQLGLGHKKDIGDTELPTDKNALLPLKDIKLVAMADEHACAATKSERMHCWGHNDKSQLGIGHRKDIGDDEPLGDTTSLLIINEDQVAFLFDAIDADHSHTALQKTTPQSSGNNRWSVHIWGDSEYFAFGVWFIVDPEHTLMTYGGIALPDGILSVSAGEFGTCGVSKSETLHCWGVAPHGEPGLGNLEPAGAHLLATVPLGQGLGEPFVPVQVAAGAWHVCVLGRNSEVKCWGDNAEGQLGLGYAGNGAKTYVGGEAAETPDHLPLVQIIQP